MNRISRFAFFCLFISCQLTAEPINGSELFTNTENRMVDISPSGTFVSRYNTEDENFLDVIDRKTLKIHASLGFSPRVSLKEYSWLNEQQLLILLKNKNINEYNIGVFNDGNIELQAIETKGYVVDSYPDNPTKVLFAKRIGKHRLIRHDLFLIDINDLLAGQFNNATQIEHNDDDASFYMYDQVSTKIFTLSFHLENETAQMKVIPFNGGTWRTLYTFSKNDFDLMPVSFFDDNTLAVITNKETDKRVLQKFDINSQQLGDIIYQHPKYDLSDAEFKQVGVLDYVSYFEHGVERNIYFEKETGNILERVNKLVNGQEANIIASSVDKSVRIIFVHGSDKPGNFIIYDNTVNKFTEFLDLYPKLKKQSFVRSMPIRVKHQGIDLEAFLTIPDNVDHKTLLVMPHGGPIGVQDTDRFNKQIQYLVSRGFSLLRVNFRGSAGFGKAFMKKGVGEFGKLIEEDISAVLQQVLTTHSFENICSMGASYGGYSAIMLAIRKPELYDCVVASYGIYDLPLLFNASNYRSGDEYAKVIEKSVGSYSQSLVDESPVYLYKKFNKPLLLIAGKDDKIASFEHSNRLKLLLSQANHPLETMFYEGTGHGHNNWYWDHHEAALVTDYLYRILNLTPLQSEHSSQTSISALKQDFLVLADGYDNSTKVNSNHEKAFEFYQQAADLEDGRASFNVGSYYHRGLFVDKNMDKATQYYQKAGDLGYSSAYKRLGRMYMEGEHFAKDYSKALNYLVKAHANEPSILNKIMLGRWYCIAPKSHNRDVDKCLSLMKEGNIPNDELKEVLTSIKESLAWITIEADLTADELEKIHSFEKEVFKVNEFTLQVNDVNSGLFTFKQASRYGKSGEYQLRGDSNRISVAEVDGYFGAGFEVNLDGFSSYNKRTALVARWYKVTSKGEKEIVDQEFLYGTSRDTWSVRKKIDFAEAGEIWTLEIYDLNQRLLFQDNYEFVAESLEEIEHVNS